MQKCVIDSLIAQLNGFLLNYLLTLVNENGAKISTSMDLLRGGKMKGLFPAHGRGWGLELDNL